MSTPVALRSNYSDLFGSSQLPALEHLFQGELTQHRRLRDVLYVKMSTDRDIAQFSELHDIDLLNEMSEGEEYTFKRPKQGASKTLTIKKMGLGFSVGMEMVEDAKFGVIADMTRKLAKSAMESQAVDDANILNNGFGGGETTADGVDLFSTAHTLPSGLTFANRPAADADLSVSSLEAGIRDFETNFIGDSNIRYNLRPRYLIVHPDNKQNAKELIGSDLKVNDVSSDNGPTNAMNTFRDEGLIVVSDPRLTDTDAWHLCTAPGSLDEHGIVIVNRQGIMTEAGGRDTGFKTDGIFYKTKYREKSGAIYPYGWYGTSGA